VGISSSLNHERPYHEDVASDFELDQAAESQPVAPEGVASLPATDVAPQLPTHDFVPDLNRLDSMQCTLSNTALNSPIAIKLLTAASDSAPSKYRRTSADFETARKTSETTHSWDPAPPCPHPRTYDSACCRDNLSSMGGDDSADGLHEAPVTTPQQDVSANSEIDQQLRQEKQIDHTAVSLDNAISENADLSSVISPDIPKAVTPAPTRVAQSEEAEISEQDLTNVTAITQSERARISSEPSATEEITKLSPTSTQPDLTNTTVIDLTALSDGSDPEGDSDLDDFNSQIGDYDERDAEVNPKSAFTPERSTDFAPRTPATSAEDMVDVVEEGTSFKLERQAADVLEQEQELETTTPQPPTNTRVFWMSYGLPLSLYVIASRNSQLKHHLLIEVSALEHVTGKVLIRSKLVLDTLAVLIKQHFSLSTCQNPAWTSNWMTDGGRLSMKRCQIQRGQSYALNGLSIRSTPCDYWTRDHTH